LASKSKTKAAKQTKSSMSGLVSFFQPFRDNADHPKTPMMEVQRQEEKKQQYHISLLNTINRDTVTNDDDDDDAGHTATAAADRTSIPNPSTSHHEPLQPTASVYDEWRKGHCRALQEFIFWRFTKKNNPPTSVSAHFSRWQSNHLQQQEKEKTMNQKDKDNDELEEEEDDLNTHFETQPTCQTSHRTQTTALMMNVHSPTTADTPANHPSPSPSLLLLEQSSVDKNECIHLLDDLSLHSTQVHISFTQIYLLKNFHDIKARHDVLSKQNHTHHTSLRYITQLDGPLFPVYRHVLPIDLLVPYPCPTNVKSNNTKTTNDPQFDNGQEQEDNTQQFIAQVVSDAFQPPTKLPQEYPTRRIHVYFYDTYAYYIQQLLVGSTRISKEKPSMYISLEYIPTHCIFPIHIGDDSRRAKEMNDDHDDDDAFVQHHELLLAEDYGLSSKYSICIGGISGIQMPQNREYISFDSQSLCIRILLVYPLSPSKTMTPTMTTHMRATTREAAADAGETKEYFIKPIWIERNIGYDPSSKAYYKQGRDSSIEVKKGYLLNLYQRYRALLLQQKLEQEYKACNEQQAVLQQTHVNANIQVNQRTTDQGRRDSRSKGPNLPKKMKTNPPENNSITTGPSDRAQSISLQHMETILIKHHEKQKMKDIPCLISTAIYTIVLGFSSPTLTRSGSYSMNITLLDPSLPFVLQNRITEKSSLSEQRNPEPSNPNNPPSSSLPLLPTPLDQNSTVDAATNENAALSSLTTDSCSTPHITLVMFASNPDYLPKLQRAGDVLVLRGFKVQKYKEEVQLLGQVLGRIHDCWYAVCRPQHTVIESIVSNPISFNLSCEVSSWMIQSKASTCLDMDQFLDVNKVVDTWKWGYHRLRTNPTIKSTSKFHVGDLEHLSVYSLDIDAVITEILPAPVNSTMNGPKGYLRIWDGTGISISHPYVRHLLNIS